MCFHGSGTKIIMASGSGIPFMTKNSKVLSIMAESDATLPMTG